jgi:hypothetical protein
MLWILDEPDDEVYCDLWRSLTDEERSAIGARGFERFRKLTPYVERAQRVPKPITSR